MSPILHVPNLLKKYLHQSGVSRELLDTFDSKITPLLIQEGRRLVMGRLSSGQLEIVRVLEESHQVTPGIPT